MEVVKAAMGFRLLRLTRCLSPEKWGYTMISQLLFTTMMESPSSMEMFEAEGLQILNIAVLQWF